MRHINHSRLYLFPLKIIERRKKWPIFSYMNRFLWDPQSISVIFLSLYFIECQRIPAKKWGTKTISPMRSILRIKSFSVLKDIYEGETLMLFFFLRSAFRVMRRSYYTVMSAPCNYLSSVPINNPPSISSKLSLKALFLESHHLDGLYS